MIIKPTKEAREGSIFTIHPGAEDFLLYSKFDDTPTPWDADVSIEGGNVVIEGSIRGGSANTPSAAGYCKCICSIENFAKWYEIGVPNYVREDNLGILDAIEKAGWVVD